MSLGATEYMAVELDALRRANDVHRANDDWRARAAYPSTSLSMSYLFAAPDRLAADALLPAGGDAPEGRLLDCCPYMLSVVRYGRGICALNMYPADPADHAVNDVLWRCAHAGECVSDAHRVLGTNILVLALPIRLAAVLRQLTLDELHACIADFKALIDDGIDMYDELKLLDDLGGLHAERGSAWAVHVAQQPQRAGRVAHLAALARLCHSPWKVNVQAAHVTANDMRTSLAAAAAVDPQPQPNHPLDDGQAPTPIRPRVRTRAPSIAVVHLKLFIDWARYRRLWVNRLGIAPIVASRVMMAAIASGVQSHAWNVVIHMLAAARRPPTVRNWAARLPRDVLWNNVAPRLLYAACSAADQHAKH